MPWNLTGNAGTNPNDFLGTTDNEPLAIRTNGVERVRIDTAGQVTIDRSGDWNSPQPSIGSESLVVKHSENGRAPGVSLVNDGGGHFVQRFQFGANSGLPQGEAASLWANWNGLVVAGNSSVSFVIGNLDKPAQLAITDGNVKTSGIVTVDRSGDWASPNPSLGGESLVVKHSENGRAPGVSFINDGGGNFVQRFQFGANSGLPQGEAASLWANWNGLVVAGNSSVSFVIGDLDNAPVVQISSDNVEITSDLTVDGDIVLTNADCAEEFDARTDQIAEPGSVMVLGPRGTIRLGKEAYDKKVAGVVSGAGEFKAAITLDRRKGCDTKRIPLALVGKVYCKVDARYAKQRRSGKGSDERLGGAERRVGHLSGAESLGRWHHR
jgi:hypothetical protein